jgi:hypothetical protein
VPSTVQSGTLIRVSGIITQLVFEHALRIRVKAETSSSPRATPAVTPEARSESTTPDNVSVVDNNVSETVSGSGEENGQSTTPSSVKGKQKGELPASITGNDDSEDAGKSSNLVGKMNNLVSSDLENIVDGRDILLLGPSSVHISLTYFLTSLPSARSIISSPSACLMHLVLIRHPWLECICRVGGDGRPLSSPWHACKGGPDGPEGIHETGRFTVLVLGVRG